MTSETDPVILLPPTVGYVVPSVGSGTGTVSPVSGESGPDGVAKFNGHSATYAFGGYTTTDSYLYADKASAEAKVNEWVKDANKSGRVYQDSIYWVAELTETSQNDLGINYSTKNDLQPTLHGGRISLPIEKHPKFRTKWKYFLWSLDGKPLSGWDTKNDLDIPKGYKISENPGDQPTGWVKLSSPTKPGVNTYDVSVYTVTDSIKCGSMATAANYVQSKLNTICTPSRKFGKTGTRMWKCDDATVTFNGRHFVATLTYTSAGDAKGWDEDIYP